MNIECDVLDFRKLNQIADEVEKYAEFTHKVSQVAEKLADMAKEFATLNFASAVYAGYNDVKVSVNQIDATTFEVVAEGESVLFIEYGTGVRYADNHPEKTPSIVPRGTYGHGRGSHKKGWHYRGVIGNAPSDTQPSKTVAGAIHTYGNPANMCLYDAREETQRRINEIVKEVFGE